MPPHRLTLDAVLASTSPQDEMAGYVPTSAFLDTHKGARVAMRFLRLEGHQKVVVPASIGFAKRSGDLAAVRCRVGASIRV